jgi:hypothetical protein
MLSIDLSIRHTTDIPGHAGYCDVGAVVASMANDINRDRSGTAGCFYAVICSRAYKGCSKRGDVIKDRSRFNVYLYIGADR